MLLGVGNYGIFDLGYDCHRIVFHIGLNVGLFILNVENKATSTNHSLGVEYCTRKEEGSILHRL